MSQRLLKEIERGSKIALTKKKIIGHYIFNGSGTTTDLAKELELSVPTVTKFIYEMVDDGYIIDYGKLETSTGRHPALYGLNPESGYFVGVEIKRKSVNIAVINFKGDMVDQRMNVPFVNDNTPESLDALCDIVRQFIVDTHLNPEKILNICIPISGRVNPDTGYSYSLFNFSERALSEVLSEKIGYPVCIDNDTRIMTYGEFLQGCVEGQKNIIFVNMSWGLGIGIVIDGKIYTGKSGFSGEFGHIATFDNELLCHCGKKGCLETEVSGQALHRIVLEHIKAGEGSILSERANDPDNPLTIEDIIDAVNNDDMLCIQVVEEMGQKLGKRIASLINIFNPEYIVVGGQLSLMGDYLTLPIKTAARKYSLSYVNKDTQIVTSQLRDRAGMVGACMVARSRMFEI